LQAVAWHARHWKRDDHPVAGQNGIHDLLLCHESLAAFAKDGQPRASEHFLLLITVLNLASGYQGL
jgi:hypothetical protein